jgi:hypothetical protein
MPPLADIQTRTFGAKFLSRITVLIGLRIPI